MKDSRSEILYIGKAKILRNRVRSYFQNSRTLHPRTTIFLGKVHDIKFLTTKTEAEALILESNFIKKHQPRYNVLLKDDKHYPYLRLSTHEKFLKQYKPQWQFVQFDRDWQHPGGQPNPGE